MNRHHVGTVGELAKNGGKLAGLPGSEVGICLVDGEVRAYRNVCPHAGAALFHGWTGGRTVRCPWHGWVFDLRTGAHVDNPACALLAVKVEVEGDEVFVWV